ncbi:MAG: cytochrome c peroxidase [Acidobacteriota bacterium]
MRSGRPSPRHPAAFACSGGRSFRAVVAALVLLHAGCANKAPDAAPPVVPSPDTLAKAEPEGPTGPFKPLPPSVSLDAGKVALGRALFNDPRLSKDDSVACARCHVVAEGGDDGMAKSVGIGGQLGDVNAPTVLNSGFNFKQFWDGRADTLEDQISGPVTHPKEMGSSFDEAAGKLRSDAAFMQKFQASYPEGPNEKTIKDAIATFERSLVTRAPFDRFLEGDAGALTDDQKKGYDLFRTYGCVSCHQGVNVGGNMFQRLGAMKSYFETRGAITKVDYGRFNVTGRESDRFKFKVPTLRNVELTAPYFHDGSAATLEDAVKVMAEFQLGRPMSDEDRHLVVEFLKSLTGPVAAGEKP